MTSGGTLEAGLRGRAELPAGVEIAVRAVEAVPG